MRNGLVIAAMLCALCMRPGNAEEAKPEAPETQAGKPVIRKQIVITANGEQKELSEDELRKMLESMGIKIDSELGGGVDFSALDPNVPFGMHVEGFRVTLPDGTPVPPPAEYEGLPLFLLRGDAEAALTARQIAPEQWNACIQPAEIYCVALEEQEFYYGSKAEAEADLQARGIQEPILDIGDVGLDAENACAILGGGLADLPEGLFVTIADGQCREFQTLDELNAFLAEIEPGMTPLTAELLADCWAETHDDFGCSSSVTVLGGPELEALLEQVLQALDSAIQEPVEGAGK